jgi:hypothetical protein
MSGPTCLHAPLVLELVNSEKQWEDDVKKKKSNIALVASTYSSQVAKQFG